jgi:hypothetical protein
MGLSITLAVIICALSVASPWGPFVVASTHLFPPPTPPHHHPPHTHTRARGRPVSLKQEVWGVEQVRGEDPIAPADWFKEGVHFVPSTEDVLRSLGHWADSEAELLQMGEDSMAVLEENEEEQESGEGRQGPGGEDGFPGDGADEAGFDDEEEE